MDSSIDPSAEAAASGGPAAAGLPAPLLVIARTLDGDAGQRQVYVELDGERVAALLAGETLTRELAPGEHRLKLDNTLVSKRYTFTAAPGDRIEYRLANTAGRFALSFLALMGVAPLFLRVETNADRTRRG